MPSEAQLLEIFKNAFDKLDTDQNGVLDMAEFAVIVKECASEFGADPPTDAEIKEVFEEADKDGSGAIEFPEFVALMKSILDV